MPASAQRSLVKPFEPSSRAASRLGPKAAMPAAREIVGDPGDQRRLRADDDQVDLSGAAETDHRTVVGDVERDQLGASAMPGLPGAA